MKYVSVQCTEVIFLSLIRETLLSCDADADAGEADVAQENGAAALESRATADSVAPAHLPIAGENALPATESDAAEAVMRVTVPDEPPPAPSQRALSEEAAHSELCSRSY